MFTYKNMVSNKYDLTSQIIDLAAWAVKTTGVQTYLYI